jgi:hypothetical protein
MLTLLSVFFFWRLDRNAGAALAVRGGRLGTSAMKLRRNGKSR